MRFDPLPVIETGQLLKRTTSRCPVCHASCPAEVWRVAGQPAKVFLKRTCAEHGAASVCIASDARFYWLAKADPENGSSRCGGSACCASDGSTAGTLGRNADGRGDAPVEKLSTCLALIEIVNSCNLSCPTCYADSPPGIGQELDFVPLDDLQRRIQGVINRKGGIEILQLSGGEPTLHPQFFELVEWIQNNPGVDYVLLNTNGVRIARDDAFLAGLAAVVQRRNFQLYLQFDGVQLEGQQALRGADLRTTRVRAIERCREIHLPITLAMTVTPDNLPFLWETIEFGLKFPHVRGVSFQPMFTSGRTPKTNAASDRGPAHELEHPLAPSLALPQSGGEGRGEGMAAAKNSRLNTADIILAAVEQSHGKLRFEDFTPLPCGDPNCATIGYLLKVGGTVRSISDFIDFTRVQGFLRDKVRYRLEDLMKCGCDSEPLGELLRQFEMDESNTFRLFIKPFMDAWTWDEDRIDRCCTHVIRPDGKLDSFCRYYSGFAGRQPADIKNQ
ncbi:MAG TPA: radical SAM protein [Candidatus Angelobacter sp.]|nr:radical SAM protein [Candidatus Angelobacter sp.]